MYTTLYPMTYYFYPLLEDKFTDSHHQNTFRQILNSPKPAVTENLLYLHIPYCHDMCRFCPFHVRVDKEWINTFIEVTWIDRIKSVKLF